MYGLIMATYDDFTKLDLCVGKITSTEPIVGKSKIFKGIIDIGDEERTVIIGGAEFLSPEDMINRTVIVVTNLEPKTIGGVTSTAMLLAADVNDRPYWLTISDDSMPFVPLGSPIK